MQRSGEEHQPIPRASLHLTSFCARKTAEDLGGFGFTTREKTPNDPN
jgi:hypothetical protein